MTLPTWSTSDRLLEREAELAAIEAAMARARAGAGSLVVIDGAAGIGKTALMDAARVAATDAGLLVLQARGAELEQAFGFGVIRQLFDAVVRDPASDPAALFTGAARLAAVLLELELDGVTAPPPDDPFALRHALYWLTANLAADQPLALLVDDAHWADRASLDVVGHIAHRLEEIPVSLVVASRAEEPLPALEALRREAAAQGTLLGLPPLGPDAAAAVVRSFAPAADDALCGACHHATGGNPFLLRELARSVGAGDGAVDAALPADQSPERVTREIAARLARLPDAAGGLARAAAILGGDVPLRQAAALAGIDLDAAAEAADTLVAAGVLRGAHPVEFLHPLVRAAVYAGIGQAARSREHARAARTLADDGAAPERVAAQLLRCPSAGDRWAFEQLRAAALLASSRGAAEAAATYLRRAVDEPAPPDRRVETLLELGTALSQSDHVAAIAHLREAIAGDIEPEQRFRATMLLAGLLAHTDRVAEAADVLEEQAATFPDRPDLRRRAEAALVNVTRIDPSMRRRAAPVIDRLIAHVHGDADHDATVLGTAAAELAAACEPVDHVADVAERALSGIRATAATAEGLSWYHAMHSLVTSERYDAALRGMAAAIERDRERGAVLDVGCLLAFRSELYVRIGDLASAEVDARTLQEIAAAYDWPLGAGFAIAAFGEVLIERGELPDAARLLTEGRYAGPASALPSVYSCLWVLLARGRLRAAQGSAEQAAEELRECGRRATASDHPSPALVPWRSQLARTLVDLGQSVEARRLATEELELARRCGAPRAIGIALRAAARVEGGDGEIRLLRDAVEVLAGSGARLERAHAHAELGAALRRAGRHEEAREQLRSAVDLAHRCGAQALEDEALAELRASGARPRRRVTTGAGALTPSERRIAELAAGGRQNREIAQTLFVTTATVEYHLRNAYRKLGIASRTELGLALGREDG